MGRDETAEGFDPLADAARAGRELADSIDHGPTAPVSPPLAAARRRPLWLVAALTFLSDSLQYGYLEFWLWMSWRELKSLRRDSGMSPFFHSLAVEIPIYGFFRFHAHYRVLNEVLAQTGQKLRYSPGVLTTVWILRSVLGSILLVFLIFNLVGGSPFLAPGVAALLLVLTPFGVFLVDSFLVVEGQRGLNSYYERASGGTVPQRVLAVEWIFLVIFALVFANATGVLDLAKRIGGTERAASPLAIEASPTTSAPSATSSATATSSTADDGAL